MYPFKLSIAITSDDKKHSLPQNIDVTRFSNTFTAWLLLAFAILAIPAQAQSVGRYETHLEPLLILDPPPNNNGTRHSGAAAVVLDRFTGSFRVCEVLITWPSPFPPGEDGTRRCYTTPPLAPSAGKVRFEIFDPHAGFAAWASQDPNQRFISLYLTDNATGEVTQMTVAGSRDANNLLVWGQKKVLTPQF